MVLLHAFQSLRYPRVQHYLSRGTFLLIKDNQIISKKPPPKNFYLVNKMENLEISRLLKKYRNIAVVGLSPKNNRPSNQVAVYLLEAGYNIIPVNPGQAEVVGKKCYPDLESIPEPVDIVDIFRKTEDVLPVVESAIKIGAKVVWMQQGIVNEEAAALARKAGLLVIMDRCLQTDHQNLAGGLPASQKSRSPAS
jgi:hypothetical protein